MARTGQLPRAEWRYSRGLRGHEQEKRPPVLPRPQTECRRLTRTGAGSVVRFSPAPLRRIRRMRDVPKIALLLLVVALVSIVAEAKPSRTLDIYFIDVEGGQATLIVTP